LLFCFGTNVRIGLVNGMDFAGEENEVPVDASIEQNTPSYQSSTEYVAQEEAVDFNKAVSNVKKTLEVLLGNAESLLKATHGSIESKITDAHKDAQEKVKNPFALSAIYVCIGLVFFAISCVILKITHVLLIFFSRILVAGCFSVGLSYFVISKFAPLEIGTGQNVAIVFTSLVMFLVVIKLVFGELIESAEVTEPTPVPVNPSVFLSVKRKKKSGSKSKKDAGNSTSSTQESNMIKVTPPAETPLLGKPMKLRSAPSEGSANVFGMDLIMPLVSVLSATLAMIFL